MCPWVLVAWRRFGHYCPLVLIFILTSWFRFLGYSNVKGGDFGLSWESAHRRDMGQREVIQPYNLIRGGGYVQISNLNLNPNFRSNEWRPKNLNSDFKI
jgi:hypothetical protein